MAKQEKIVRVSTSAKELEKTLSSMIKSPYSELISRTIINNLAESPVGWSQLFKAFSGVEEIIPFKLLDEIFVPSNSLATWKMDLVKMKDAGLIHKKEMVKCVIIDINPYSYEPLKVRYEIITNSGAREYYENVIQIGEDVQLLTSDFL